MAKKKKDFVGMLKNIPTTEQTLTDDDQETVVRNSYPGERWLPTEAVGELTMSEQEQLEACEATIRENLESFLSVGKALWEIRQGKLYRATHKTFEAYCDEKFGLERRNAYHLMEGVTVVAQLRLGAETDPANTPVLPSTHSHARALTNIEAEQRQEVWNTVVGEAQETGKPITAKKIAETNERLSGKSRKKPSKPAGKPKISGKTDDEFGEDQADITRQAMNNSFSPINQDSDGEDRVPEGAQHLQDADFVGTLKIAMLASGPADIQVTISGAFLMRYGLDEGWQRFRRLPRAINQDFSDTLSYQEARELGIL